VLWETPERFMPERFAADIVRDAINICPSARPAHLRGANFAMMQAGSSFPP